MNKEHWRQLMVAFRIADGMNTFDALVSAYSEKHRHYHTARHIDDCLNKLDAARPLAQSPEEVEIALWFHDAVYDPYKSDNEERSAEWARAFLSAGGVEAARVVRIAEHILATKHQVDAVHPDAQLLVDIDLSILGANESDYGTFEKNVREEYKWVPAMVFRKKRAEILHSFLDRPRIYNTSFFRDRYERQARVNLAAAIALLSG